jgi:hypothetical protein
MLTRLIINLIRLRLGVRRYEKFRFDSQTSRVNYYFFTERMVMKHSDGYTTTSSVSLNWLLDPNCKVVKIK